MVPIIISKEKEFDENTFKDFILNICETHKTQQKALAFAFIVYDFEDQAINKILKDYDYWSALDKLSGQFLSVFYVNSQDDYYTRRQKEIYYEQKKIREENERKGIISYFVPLTLQKTPLEKTIELIKRNFQIDEDINHPFVLFFQTQDKTITDYFILSLNQEKVEDAFLELKEHLRSAVEGIKNVLHENYENHQEIFDLLKGSVKSGKLYKFISKKVVPNIKLAIETIILLVTTLNIFGTNTD